jgi:hypothetical protein
LANAARNVEELLGALPPGVTLRRGLRSAIQFDVILLFVTSRRDLVACFEAARARMAPACGLWCCWPKKSSGVATDLTEDVIRELALASGLVDNKVCAIDETWSGLRIVIRTEDREAAR